MPDILEEVLQYEAKLMLKQFIQEDKYLTLQKLNSSIENFDLDIPKGSPDPHLRGQNIFQSRQ